MKRTTTAATVLALAAGSLAVTAPAATAAPAAPAVTQAAPMVQEGRFPERRWNPRAWVCDIAPALCR